MVNRQSDSFKKTLEIFLVKPWDYNGILKILRIADDLKETSF